jgi:hypothetical protein
MPFSVTPQYSELTAATADWLNRSDLTAQVPDFVILAEAEMRRRLRRGTVRNTAFTINAVAMTLPADCAEMRSIWLVSGQPTMDIPLRNCTPEMLAERRARAANVAGRPTDFAIEAGQLVFAPTPDQTYTAEIFYYSKIAPLTALAPTSALFTENPDIYLYGTLLQAEPYLENDERVDVWKTKFNDAINQLNLVRENEEYMASIRSFRLPRTF